MACVETSSENDLANELGDFVATLLSIGPEEESSSTQLKQQLRKLTDTKQYASLIDTVLDMRTDLFKLDAVAEVECCFNAVFSLAAWLPKSERKNALFKIAKGVTENTQDNSVLRMKIMVNAYNTTLADSSERFDIFCTLVNYATTSGNVSMLRRYLLDVDAVMQSGTLTNDQRRVIYLLVADALCEDGVDTAESQVFLVKYLKSFEGTTAPSEAKQVAERVLINAVNNPLRDFTQSEDVVSLSVMKQVNSSLLLLAKILATENLPAYTQFHAKNAAVFSKHGFDHEKLLESMRLLTISSLAAEQIEIPYSTLRDSLEIQDEEIEEWVVKAIAAGLLHAKMDQLSKTVIVRRCLRRTFELKDWKNLSEKLLKWKSNIGQLLKTIQQSKEGLKVESI